MTTFNTINCLENYNKYCGRFLILNCSCYKRYKTEQRMIELVQSSSSYLGCAIRSDGKINHCKFPIMLGSFLDFQIRGIDMVTRDCDRWGAFIILGNLKILQYFITNNVNGIHRFKEKHKIFIKWLVQDPFQEYFSYTLWLNDKGKLKVERMELIFNEDNFMTQRSVTLNYKKDLSWLVAINHMYALKSLRQLCVEDVIDLMSEFFKCDISLDSLSNKILLSSAFILSVAYENQQNLPTLKNIMEKGSLYFVLSKHGYQIGTCIKLKGEFESTQLWTDLSGSKQDNIKYKISSVKRYTSDPLKKTNALYFPEYGLEFICPLTCKELTNAGESLALAQWVITTDVVNFEDVFTFIIENYRVERKDEKENEEKVVDNDNGDFLKIIMDDIILSDCLIRNDANEFCKIKRKFQMVSLFPFGNILKIHITGNIPAKYSAKYEIFVSPFEREKIWPDSFDWYGHFSGLSDAALELDPNFCLLVPPIKMSVSITNLNGKCCILDGDDDMRLKPTLRNTLFLKASGYHSGIVTNKKFKVNLVDDDDDNKQSQCELSDADRIELKRQFDKLDQLKQRHEDMKNCENSSIMTLKEVFMRGKHTFNDGEIEKIIDKFFEIYFKLKMSKCLIYRQGGIVKHQRSYFSELENYDEFIRKIRDPSRLILKLKQKKKTDVKKINNKYSNDITTTTAAAAAVAGSSNSSSGSGSGVMDVCKSDGIDDDKNLKNRISKKRNLNVQILNVPIKRRKANNEEAIAYLDVQQQQVPRKSGKINGIFFTLVSENPHAEKNLNSYKRLLKNACFCKRQNYHFKLYSGFADIGGFTVEDGLIIGQHTVKKLPPKVISYSAQIDLKTFTDKNLTKTMKQSCHFKYTVSNRVIDDEIVFGTLQSLSRIKIRKSANILVDETNIKNIFIYKVFMKNIHNTDLTINSHFDENRLKIVLNVHTIFSISVGSKMFNLFGQKNVVSSTQNMERFKCFKRDGTVVIPDVIFGTQSAIGRTATGQALSLVFNDNVALSLPGTVTHQFEHINKNGEKRTLATQFVEMGGGVVGSHNIYLHNIDATQFARQGTSKNDLMTRTHGFIANDLTNVKDITTQQTTTKVTTSSVQQSEQEQSAANYYARLEDIQQLYGHNIRYL